jgi:hypothetical protein
MEKEFFQIGQPALLEQGYGSALFDELAVVDDPDSAA